MYMTQEGVAPLRGVDPRLPFKPLQPRRFSRPLSHRALSLLRPALLPGDAGPALDGHALSLLQPVVVSLRAAGAEAGTEAGIAAVAGERGGQGDRTQRQTPKPQPSPKPRASEQVGGSGRVRRSG